MLDIYKLQHQYLSLNTRTRALRSSKVEQAEGYELTETNEKTVAAGNEKVAAIKKEWRAWKLASIKNTYVSSALHTFVASVIHVGGRMVDMADQ